MKILYATHARLPTEKAYGAQIVKTCEALAKAGMDVILACPRRHGNTPERIRSAYGVEAIFDIEIFDTPDFLHWGVIGFWLSEWFFARKLAAYLKRVRVDALYSRDELPILYAPRTAAALYEAHTPRWNILTKHVARKTDVFVVITDALGKWFARRGVSREKLVTIPDAVDLAPFEKLGTPAECRRQLNVPLAQTVVGYVGHLYYEKGVHILAQALHHLPESVSCYVVGGNPRDVTVFRERYGADARMHVLGHQPWQHVPLWLRACDVLVLPNTRTNRTTAEFTSPMKLFEYMASGTPIVAADVPALREVLSDKEAFFFTPDDPAGLATSIKQVLANPQEAGERSDRAREVVATYTWLERAQKVLSAISKI